MGGVDEIDYFFLVLGVELRPEGTRRSLQNRVEALEFSVRPARERIW
ncbi:hypothetical protein I553_10411 [Mycobacterium xenopi 4042]|uniref:Uncharacterized protein n=1 Tax=Mycobacterium xenopi 4042 TaxID=1299334 RepID=X7ZI59_MYCXE|nr:hypothetical protein I553_10411 [Mycobacterium xenopi 4042]